MVNFSTQIIMRDFSAFESKFLSEELYSNLSVISIKLYIESEGIFAQYTVSQSEIVKTYVLFEDFKRKYLLNHATDSLTEVGKNT